jgi:hypothetical protein
MLSAEEKARRNKLKRRNLWLESLEDRSLMATIDLVVNLYENNGGVPGALIENDTVAPGQEFFVEITVQDTSDIPSGVNRLALDISFDATAFEEIDNPFDPSDEASPIITAELPLFRGGDLSNASGTIDELTGSSNSGGGFGSPIGIAVADPFALMLFRADSTISNSPFTITIGNGGVQFEDSEVFESATIEAQTITVAAPALPTLSIDDVTQAEGSTEDFTLYQFIVTLSESSSETVQVTVNASGGTATSGTDYEALTSTLVEFAPGETSQTVTVKVAADLLHEGDETFEVKLSNPVGATLADDTGLGTITNDDTINVSLSGTVTQAEASTGTTSFEFTATLDAVSAIDVVVPWTLENVTTNDADFNAGQSKSGTVTIPAGQLSAKLPAFLVNGDNTVELDETFTVTLGAPTTAGVALVSDAKTVTGTITNDDSATITMTPVAQAEGNSGTANMAFEVTLSNPVDIDVTVDYSTADGTALLSDNDYTETKGTLTFAAGGALTQTINVPIVGDTTVEADETFTLTLSAVQATGRNVTAGEAVTGTIQDDDDSTPTISIDDATIAEGESGETLLTFTVTLSEKSATPVTLKWSTADITALSASDYTAVSEETLTIPADTLTQTITVKINGDKLVEKDETLKVTLSDLSGAKAGDLEAIGTITNDDIAVASITESVTQVEGDSGTKEYEYTVSIDQAAEFDVVIPWTFNHVTTNDADFDPSLTKSGTVTIPAGETSVKIPAFKTAGDFSLEADETFTVALGTPEDAQVQLSETKATGTGTIENDDDATVSISPQVKLNEGNTGATDYEFEVSVDNAAGIDIVVPWTFTHTTTTDEDFDGSLTKSGTITIPAGQTSVKIPAFKVLGDTAIETDETFLVTLGTPETEGVTLSVTNQVGEGTVQNDDVEATITASITQSVSQDEGNSGTTSYEYTVTIDQASESDVVIPWTFAHVSTNDADFEAGFTKSGTVTIPAGQTSIKIPVFKVLGDTTFEQDETFTVTLGTPETSEVKLSAEESVGTGTVLNDDQVLASITKTVSQAEGQSGTTDYEFTVTIDQAFATDVVIPWTFAHVNSEDGDFEAGFAKSGTVTIPAGETSAKIPAFKVVGDDNTENDETFTVALGTPETEGVGLSADKIGTGVIQNDDGLTASITQNVSLTEGDSGNKSFEFEVSLDQDALVDTVIPWTFNHGTTSTGDFAEGLVTTGKVTITAGQKTAKFSFTVAADTVLEGDETFTVTLGQPETNGVALSVDKTGTGTIENDDEVTVSITPSVSQNEGNSGTTDYNYTVSIDQVAEIDVVVPWTFNHGTTTAGDFSNLTTSGTVTIPAGQKTAQIPSFKVIGDTSFEADETFTVTLQTPTTSGALLSETAKTGTGTIENDDSIVASITKEVKLNEGNSGTTDFEFTVTIDHASDVDVVIPWTFTNITSSDNDFSNLTKSGKITIPAGQTSIKIPAFQVNGDTTVEGDETFTVTLGDPETEGVVLSSTDKTGTATILTDDTATASITKTVTQNEGNSGNTSYEFTVTLDKASAVDVVIPWTMANVTTTDADFANLTKTGKITIPAGQTSIKIPAFSVIGNNIVEGNETFTVTLGIPETAGVVLSSTDNVGTGTITNDDSATIAISNASQVEPGTGTATITLPVTLSAPADVDVTVTWTFTHVTTVDGDFVSLTKTGTLTFLAGQTTPTTPLTFTIAADTLDEPNETFTVTLGDPTFATGVTRNITTPTATKVGTGTISVDSKTGVISGSVYVDTNNNGIRDANEVGVPGVVVTLTGTTTAGAAVTHTAMTADDGTYSFINLIGGKYQLVETQPGSMSDGTDVVGTAGGTMTNDKFADIQLDPAEQATGYHFGEAGLLPQFVSRRLFLASTIGQGQPLRLLNARAAELAGNSTLADQIANGSIPSVVNANPTASTASTATTESTSGGEDTSNLYAAGEDTSGDDAASFAAMYSAGEATEEDVAAPVTTSSSAAAKSSSTTKTATTKKVTTKSTSTAKSTVKVTATKKSTTASSSVAKVSKANTVSSRTSALLSLQSSSSAGSNAAATDDSLQLMALDELMAREKKWR